MTIAFYADEHIKRAIIDGLRLRDVDIVTVQEDGFRAVDDPLILDRATQLNRLVFTNDDDFIVEAHKRQVENEYFSSVVYAAQQTAIGLCIRDLELIAKLGELDEFANRVTYLPF
ncbi:MAG: DUF5615 family PIN-like protein [Chloroflexota bacterium]